MSILTPAELRSLALTLVFLVVGAGARLWRSSQVRLGPYLEGKPGTATSIPSSADTAGFGGFPAPGPADSALPSLQDPSAGSSPSGSEDDLAAAMPFSEDRGLLVHASLATPTLAEPSGFEPRSTRVPRPATPRTKKGRDAPRKTSAVKVALNQAGIAELAQVPGIGEKTAEAILAYRKAHGPFMDLRELLHVKGIGEKKLERITPCLVLSPVREEEPARQAGLPP